MKTWLNILLSAAFLGLVLAGCGDLGKTEKASKSLESSNFAVNDCTLNVDAFSRILYDSISSEIICLQKNLHLYLRMVESDRPNHLGRVAFEAFIRNYMPEVDADTVKAIQVVFELNHLITGEDLNYISAENVDRLINFALVFNREAAKNYAPIFEDEDLVSYEVHVMQRKRISAATMAMRESIEKIYVPERGGKTHKINLLSFVEKLTNDSNREDMEKFKKFLFAKKAVIGGDESLLTHVELGNVINNFEELSLIILDLYRYQYVTIDQASFISQLHEDVTNLDEIMFPNGKARDKETLFTLDQVIEAVKVFVAKEDLDIDKLKRPLEDGKRMIMGGDIGFVTGADMKKLFSHAYEVLNKGKIFHLIYSTFKAQLDSPYPVDVNFSHYRQNYPERGKELEQFERIVKKYRFYKGEFASPYFSLEHKRNADAIFEIALWEHGLKILFEHYGLKSNGLGGYSMNQKKVQEFIAKYDQELIDLDLFLPGMGRINADNIALLGTLFQFQADNNEVLDVNEASEFAVSLVTSIMTSKEIFKQLVNKHQCSTDNYERIDPNCFRTNFFKSLCELYRPHFSRMFDAYNLPKNCEEIVTTGASSAYLNASINAARTCNYYPDGKKEEIYYSEGDIVTIMVVLMHIETTIIRWDKNQNNYMDPSEVEAAYSIYSGALDGFLEGRGIIKKFKKQIYQYMIKYETVPDDKKFSSIMKFIRFLLTINKKSSADRKTIANILYQIGEQNKKLPGYIPFDCKALRNPTNIDPSNQYVPVPVTPAEEETNYGDLLKPYEHLAEPKH